MNELFSILVDFIKDWVPLWLAIFAFLLNIYNQNLKNYREIKRDSKVFFLKHRMFLQPLEEILIGYREVYEINNNNIQQIVGCPIKDMELMKNNDFRDERVIGYCVYNRKGNEKDLFSLYIRLINDYNALIINLEYFEDVLYNYIQLQIVSLESVNSLYFEFDQNALKNGFTINNNGLKSEHPKSAILKEFYHNNNLDKYFLDFTMFKLNYTEFENVFLDKINKLLSYNTKDTLDEKRLDSDSLYKWTIEINCKWGECKKRLEDFSQYQSQKPLEYYNEFLELIAKIEKTPFKGHYLFNFMDFKDRQ
jgi:hypothetical protein